MKKAFVLFLTLVMMLTCLPMSAFAAQTPAEEPAQQPAQTTYRNVMYYGDWSIYDCQDYFNPSDIDASLITHLNFAFVDMDANGDLILCDEYADFEAQLPEHGKDELMYDAPYSGVFGAMYLLREKNPNLKIGISIGGWTRSGDFSAVAADPAKRKHFAQNAAKFVDYLGFDFVDIDWEYPCDVRPSDPEGNGVAIDEGCPGHPDDGHNFTLLMKDLRTELDALGEKNGKYYELSAAMSANTNKMKCIEYDEVLKYADFLNMMTYDLNGSWNDYTGHQTGLYTNPAYDKDKTPDGVFSIDTAIQYLKDTYGNNIDYSKIVVGVASYTRGWSGVKGGLDPKNPGVFAPALANSVPDEEKLKGGVYAYHDIPTLKQKYGVEEYYDETAQAAYLYGPDTGYFFTYDNTRSVAAKGAYVQENGLGGLICWMASQDKDHELTRTMKESLIGKNEFPAQEIIVAAPDVEVSVRASGKSYTFTIKNKEKTVESNNAMKRAERFQKTVMNGKFYIKTKDGCKFTPGQNGFDHGKITNKDGIGIIDFTGHYENQCLEAGKTITCTFQSNKPANLDNIESITMTQKILPSMPEFGTTVVYGEGAAVKPDPQPMEEEVKTVKVIPASLQMKVGDTKAVKAMAFPLTAKDKTITWTSGNEEIATIENGKVTAVAAGTVNITASSVNGKKAVCKVTVEDDSEKPNPNPNPNPKPNPDPDPNPNPNPNPNPDPKPDPKPDPQPSKGTWAPYVNYAVGDVVTYNGVAYVCTMAHMSLDNWEPCNVPAIWSVTTDAPAPNPDPDPDPDPETKPDPDPDPQPTPDPDPDPEIKPDPDPDPQPEPDPDPEQKPDTKAEWKANTAYKVGDVATYKGVEYVCGMAHTSLTGWEPCNVPALWQVK